MNERALKVAVATLTLLVLLPSAAVAQSKGWTDTDYAMLPEVCSARLRSDQPVYAELRRQWTAKLGRDTMLHLHHYCFGIRNQQKATLAVDRGKKKEELRACTREFGYVLRHWPANAALRADAESRLKSCETLLKMLGN